SSADRPTEAPVNPGTMKPVGAESLEPVGADLFLVQRSPLLRHHPGQIALPGGGLESGDAGPEAAAVRETEEETGISPKRVEVLGKLPALMLPISSFVVTPVLGWAPWIPPVTDVEQDEVLHTLRVPVDSLLEPQMRSTIGPGGRRSARDGRGDGHLPEARRSTRQAPRTHAADQFLRGHAGPGLGALDPAGHGCGAGRGTAHPQSPRRQSARTADAFYHRARRPHLSRVPH